MKYLITSGRAIVLLCMLTAIPFYNIAAEQTIRDHRVSPSVNKQDSTRRTNTVVKVMPVYKVSWYRPVKMPADIEDWLNERMKGYGLIAITKDETSGRYNSIFKRLYNDTWNYTVRIVSGDGLEAFLVETRKSNLELVAVTSEDHGPRGLMYFCFFRQH